MPPVRFFVPKGRLSSARPASVRLQPALCRSGAYLQYSQIVHVSSIITCEMYQDRRWTNEHGIKTFWCFKSHYTGLVSSSIRRSPTQLICYAPMSVSRIYFELLLQNARRVDNHVHQVYCRNGSCVVGILWRQQLPPSYRKARCGNSAFLASAYRQPDVS